MNTRDTLLREAPPLVSARLNRDLALKARKLAVAGLNGKAIGEKLKVATTEANNLANVGGRIEAMEAATFTDAEVLLLRSIAKVHRRLISEMRICSPQSREVAYAAGRSSGWPAATCQKRLTLRWDAVHRRNDGLGLVKLAGNGYINLTSAGWMVIHAIEAAETAARSAPVRAAA